MFFQGLYSFYQIKLAEGRKISAYENCGSSKAIFKLSFMSITIYHNPKCSKSRQTLKLLQEQGINPLTIEYLKNPPTVEKLKEILSLLGVSPRDLMRKKENEYKELGLASCKLSDRDLIRYMVKNPILIERPIVLANGKAALGRPPEQVLNILN